eukprot:3137610-Amphidinium_carterae.1
MMSVFLLSQTVNKGKLSRRQRCGSASNDLAFHVTCPCVPKFVSACRCYWLRFSQLQAEGNSTT